MIPLEVEAQMLENSESYLGDLRGALGSVATDVIRLGGDQNTPILQDSSNKVVVRSG